MLLPKDCYGNSLKGSGLNPNLVIERWTLYLLLPSSETISFPGLPSQARAQIKNQEPEFSLKFRVRAVATAI